MKHPRIVVVERDRRIAEQLATLANDRRWVLRECRQIDACERLLAEGGPVVLVVRLAVPLDQSVELLSRTANRWSDVRCVAVGEALPAALAGLIWDLGVDIALLHPLPESLLPAIVARLMESAS